MRNFKGLGPHRLCGLLLVAGFLFPTVGLSQSTTNVDVNGLGEGANNSSLHPTISVDGRYVAFSTVATNLVSGDHNDLEDDFVHDRKTNTTRLVSVNKHGEASNDGSQEPVMSGDGRFVAFVSFATNLVANGEGLVGTIFVRDRANPDRADVDGDEIADIVWRNQVTGATAVWLMEPRSTHTSQPRKMTFPGVAPLDWKIRGVGDVNNDGKADVTWPNTQNGATAVWLMNSEGLRQGATFPGGAELEWELRP